MKKRGIFYLFFTILSLIWIPNVYSIYGEQVYSGTIEDGDRVSIEGSLFEFRIDPQSRKSFVQIDGSGFIVPNGECKIMDNFNTCIKNVSYSYKNFTTFRDIYKALVKVYQIKSKIDITNTIEKSSILIGEETTATLTIENTADIVAKDVIATINIPPSVLVTDVEGCKKIFDEIVFEDNIHPTQIRECIYKIKGLTGDDFELTADVSFFDGIKTINTTSATLKAKVYDYALNISSKLDKGRFNIREKLNLIINLGNTNDQYDLIITNFNIKIPENFQIIKKPIDTAVNNKIITWSGTLPPDENKNFSLELQGLRTANNSVLIGASYKINKFLRIAKEEFNINVYCDCPNIFHDFSQQIAVPDQRVGLKVYIKNPSPINEFRNVEINYLTNIPNLQDFSTAYAKISPLETINIFDSEITTPSLNEIYHFNTTATYKLVSNQVFVVRDNIIIKIPKIEEETIVEKEQETREEEQQEIESKEEIEEVNLGSEITDEITDESDKNEDIIGEITLTEIKFLEEIPLKALTIIAFIVLFIFIFVVLLIFKSKKSRKSEKEKDPTEKESKSDIKGEKIQIIKESIFGKPGKKRAAKRGADYNKDYEYMEMKKRINNIKITPEGQEKTGFFGKIFRKK